MSNDEILPASVLLVGCGRMGVALLSGWREHLPVSALDPLAPPMSGVRWLTDASELARIFAEATLRSAGAPCDGSAFLAELRAAVTSPGGTTAAGLGRLDSVDALVCGAVEAAIVRARELAC